MRKVHAVCIVVLVLQTAVFRVDSTWWGNRDSDTSSIMFYLVGLGLGDAKDITVKGLEVVKRAKRVYLEAYTSILTVGKDALVI